MTQQTMVPANAKPAGPPSVTIDLGSPDPLIVHLGESSITLWPMKEHIYREYVQSVPQLAKLLPKDGEKSDGKDLLKKARSEERRVGKESGGGGTTQQQRESEE